MTLGTARCTCPASATATWRETLPAVRAHPNLGGAAEISGEPSCYTVRDTTRSASRPRLSDRPAGPAARATPPRRSPESSPSRSAVTASSTCAIATMPSGRSGSKPWRSSSPNAIGNRHGLASPTTRSSGTRRLCRGRPRPGEAGRGQVESRATGLAVALRSRGRARPDQPHRRRTRIRRWMPGVERRASPCRCPGAIQIEMLASTVGCRHPVADDGGAVQ